jgi:hypothetical protein
MATTYEAIETKTISGTSTTSVTFTSIPQTYTDLVLIANAQSSLGAGPYYVYLAPNSDTTANKSFTWIRGDGSAASSLRVTNDSYLRAGSLGTSGSTFGTSISHIMNYTNTSTYKTILSRGGNADANTIAVVGLWRSTSAISSLLIVADALTTFTAGSTFTLYGIKAA